MATMPGMLVMMETVIGHTTIKIMEIIGHSKSNFKVACTLKNMSGINGVSGMGQVEMFTAESWLSSLKLLFHIYSLKHYDCVYSFDHYYENMKRGRDTL